MQWDSGFFKTPHGCTIDEQNITMDTMNLMMESFKIIDESRYSATAIVNPSAESAGPAPKLPLTYQTTARRSKNLFMQIDPHNQRRVDSFG